MHALGRERTTSVANNGLEIPYSVIVTPVETRDNWENKINVKSDIVNKYNTM